MESEPSLLRFVGIAVFLTIVAVLIADNVRLGESLRSRLLVSLTAFAVVQTTVAYLMIRNWLEYAERNGLTATPGETTSATPED